jgi:uncharacterized protein (TIGR00369 family)
MQPGTPRRDQYAPLPPDVAARWQTFGRWDRPYYPNLLGMAVEEIRTDYCRMRLPFQPILEQPAGVVHGGAIASLIDAVVVPAIGTAYGPDTTFVTVDLQMQYLGALRSEDAVAEGWIVQRGRSMVFCEAEVLGASSGRRVARGLLTYMVRTTAR